MHTCQQGMALQEGEDRTELEAEVVHSRYREGRYDYLIVTIVECFPQNTRL